jgi:hypothetical protein
VSVPARAVPAVPSSVNSNMPSQVSRVTLSEAKGAISAHGPLRVAQGDT